MTSDEIAELLPSVAALTDKILYYGERVRLSYDRLSVLLPVGGMPSG